MHRGRFHRSSILVAAVAVAVLGIVVWQALTPSSETPPKPSETPGPIVSATPNTEADSDVRHKRTLIEAQESEPAAAHGQIPRTLEHFPFDVLLNYDRLARQAEAGNVHAAKALYRLVLRCKHVAVDPDEVSSPHRSWTLATIRPNPTTAAHFCGHCNIFIVD